MKNSKLPKLFAYACTWLLAFVVINLVIGAINVAVRGKESIVSLGFDKGMLLLNDQPAGISIQFFLVLTVFLVIIVAFYRRRT